MPKSREEFFYFVLNNSQECIIKYDSHGCINYCNDRLFELTGYSAGELIGKYVGELFLNVFVNVDDHIQLTDEYKDKEVIETALYRKNKTCFPVEIKVVSKVFDGAVVTENIFAIPGVGVLLINAVKARDVPIVMGTVIFVTIIVGMINLVVDIVCALIDPRIDFAS